MIEGLKQLHTTHAMLLKDDGESEVDASRLRPGDMIVVRPGDVIAADGEVVKGESSLEDGFYDGSTFHEVTSGFAARAGCPLGDGTGSPGYFIRHEFGRPDRRIHLRGSLATVSEGPVASGSQFYLTFLPIPQLEEQSTVFGRVVRGMDVLARLQRRGTDAMAALVRPDRIVSAKVTG